MYRCLNCKKDINSEDIARKVNCPFCGYRILIKKKNPAVVSSVQAK